MANDVEAIVSQVLADPPLVHSVFNEQGRETDNVMVWSTEAECYRLMGERCTEGSRTFETGLGASTALFAKLRTEHVCIAYRANEVERFREYCGARGMSADRISFHVGQSEFIVPGLDLADLDLVFIDGGHGFPTPIIDWFYAAGHLRKGGTLVLDDTPLPAVGILMSFLDRDARWVKLARTEKWAAYERASEGTLGEDWWAQKEFFGPAPPLRTSFLSRVRRRLGRLVR